MDLTVRSKQFKNVTERIKCIVKSSTNLRLQDLKVIDNPKLGFCTEKSLLKFNIKI